MQNEELKKYIPDDVSPNYISREYLFKCMKYTFIIIIIFIDIGISIRR